MEQWLTGFNIETVVQLLRYNPKEPLLFTQHFFWAFFALVLLLYSIVYKKKGLRNGYLFFVSLFFYYKTSGLFVSILLFSTLSDFVIGLIINGIRKQWLKKSLVALSVSINLFLLVYFKYAYFFTDSFNNFFLTSHDVFNHFAQWTNAGFGTHFEVNKILLPVGISFYTFQTISYAVDVYRGDVKPVKNILDFGFYVSFFPQLVAGPIVRAAEFIPQLYQPYRLTKQQFGLAMYWILKGWLKKVVIGDYIAVNFIDRVFDNPQLFTGFENLMALYGYSLQVYADFSGYTDMAIGIALLMGFSLPTNFNSPYKAKNVGEFWKRWHISLSSWLKDYLYIPLGGNRTGSIGTLVLGILSAATIILLSQKIWVLYLFIWLAVVLIVLITFVPRFKKWFTTNINLLITMLLGGLWHGANWQFVIWGGLNGLGLVVYKLWRKISPYEKYNNWLSIIVKVLLTFNFITFTRIWFRAQDLSSTNLIIQQITANFQYHLIPDVLLAYQNVFIVMAVGYIIHWLPTSWKNNYKNSFIRLPLIAKIVIAALTVFGIYQSMSSNLQPFIYFQF